MSCRIIADSYIQKQIDDCKCPESMYCTVATTSCSQHERERKCMLCWFYYCKTNNISIDYER